MWKAIVRQSAFAAEIVAAKTTAKHALAMGIPQTPATIFPHLPHFTAIDCVN